MRISVKPKSFNATMRRGGASRETLRPRSLLHNHTGSEDETGLARDVNLSRRQEGPDGCAGREKNREEVQGGSEIKGRNGTGVNDDIKSTSDDQRQKTKERTESVNVGEEKSKQKIMDEKIDKRKERGIKQRGRMRSKEQKNRGKNQGAERKDETV
ncbi:hypothetical protein NDU88_011375 [Pleurodeles waltl]|uniref:Uncharacterized protein n=1 Tax=Pleurodeles waltl TaxID=8319 RepID=A0AAV7S3N3_PLEWA|nr:hypothetical protein NDU88_011375 [Pleurodeles waltl]